MTTTTTPTMSAQEVSERVAAARAHLREAANQLLTIARAMGDERDFSLETDSVITLIRRAHDEARFEGEQWEGRAQA